MGEAMIRKREHIARTKPERTNPDDVILWPDDFWCYASERGDFHWRSDDYERIPVELGRWQEIVGTD